MAILELKPDNGLIERLMDNIPGSLGYDGYETIPAEIKNILEETLITVKRTARPGGIFRILPVLRINREGVYTEAGTIRSRMFSSLVNKCSGDCFIVFMIATSGSELGGVIHPGKKVLNQWIMDKVGSELAELAADLLDEDWKKQTEVSGLQHSMRFSPGFCDWPLEEQAVIFNSLNPEMIGVRLTAYSVMHPEKSISSVAVAADRVPIKVPCGFCDRKDCGWRRTSGENALN